MYIKQLFLMGFLALGLLCTIGCHSTKTKAESTENSETEIAVSGEITAIVNGKDGYTATLKTDEGKEYEALISIVNLSERNGAFTSHSIGDKISVKGSFWKDTEGKTHIVVKELKQIK